MVRFNLHARTNCIWPIKAWESFHADTNLFLKKLELHYLWTEGAVINGFGGFWAYLCMFNHVHVYIYICARPTSLGAALLWYGCPEFSVVIFFYKIHHVYTHVSTSMQSANVFIKEGNVLVQSFEIWRRLLNVVVLQKCTVLFSPFQIINHFIFYRYINFTMHLHMIYIQTYKKTIHLEKLK